MELPDSTADQSPCTRKSRRTSSAAYADDMPARSWCQGEQPFGVPAIDRLQKRAQSSSRHFVACLYRSQGVSDLIAAGREAAAQRESLAADLRAHVRGEVQFTAGDRALYSTDSSNYRQLPIGVVRPLDTEDLAEVIRVCRDHEAPLTLRGGGIQTVEAVLTLAREAIGQRALLGAQHIHGEKTRIAECIHHACRVRQGHHHQRRLERNRGERIHREPVWRALPIHYARDRDAGCEPPAGPPEIVAGDARRALLCPLA